MRDDELPSLQRVAHEFRERVRPDVTRALFDAVLAGSSESFRFSRWLNAAVGAFVVVALSNLADIAGVLSAGVLARAMWFLLVSALLGAASEWIAVDFAESLAARRAIHERTQELLAKHEEIADMIGSVAAEKGEQVRLDPSVSDAAKPLLDALWWPFNRLFARSLALGQKQPWRAEQQLILRLQVHRAVVVVQLLSALAAVAQIAVGVQH